MKSKIQIAVVATGLALSGTSSADRVGGGQAAEPTPPSASAERITTLATITAKRFCVALRRGDIATLRELTEPRYLTQHGIAETEDLQFATAPVLGIHNIEVGSDGSTVLCLYETRSGEKEAMVLRTRFESDRVYVVPPTPPSGTDGTVTPWILRSSLEGFIKD